MGARFIIAIAAILTASPAPAIDTGYVLISKRYAEPPPLSLIEKRPEDQALLGARFSTAANNRAGELLGHTFRLHERILGPDDAPRPVIEAALADGHLIYIVDLARDDLLSIADAPGSSNAVILNVRAPDDDLRGKECRRNVFHLAPSRAMRADAIGQYLVWKKWRRWFLVSGKHPEDRAFSASIERTAKRYGARIVARREYKLETGSRRVETGHQQIQTQMPMLTRVSKEHDVVIVADERESFGLYLPYRTALPRPVVGSYGLVASAWHRSYEQYGAMAIQGGFETFAGRERV